MRINCLGCGHMIDIGDDYENYSGPIKCRICGAMLDMLSKEGDLKSIQLIPDPSCCPT